MRCIATGSATVCYAVPLVLQVKCCACDVGMAVVSDPEAARNATEAPSLLCALCDGMLDGDVEFNTLASILASCPTTLCVLPRTSRALLCFQVAFIALACPSETHTLASYSCSRSVHSALPQATTTGGFSPLA